MAEPVRETYETKGPRCPHCKHLHQPDEAFFFEEDATEMDCLSCGTTFAMEVYKSFSWTCRPTPTAGEAQ